MLGAHSFALVQTRRRLIKKRIYIEPDIAETPSGIARDYLKIEYIQGPRGTKSQLARVSGIEPVPAYAAPHKFAHGIYLDIRSCYWSIMNIVGWDVDYNPGYWLSPGKKPKNFPFQDHKIARNCLVSAGRMTGIPMFDPRKLPDNPYRIVRSGNKLTNNQLPRLIHDVLNSIAEQCINAGAIYFNNDGMIAPTPGIAAKCSGIVSDWGLTVRIKGEGAGEVKGSGVYRVGSARTLTYRSLRDAMPLNNIYPPSYKKWLQKEFSFFA